MSEVCRKIGISKRHSTTGKKNFGDLGPSELRRLRQLEEENRQLKKLVADRILYKQMLQDVLSKKSPKPAQKRSLVNDLYMAYRVGIQLSFQVMGLKDRFTITSQ